MVGQVRCMLTMNDKFKKVCKLCGSYIPPGLRMSYICPDCLIKKKK